MKTNKVFVTMGRQNRKINLFTRVLAEELGEDLNGGNEEELKDKSDAEQIEEAGDKIPERNGSVNFEDLIAKARKDERDKLYAQIEKVKKDKNDLLLVVGERDKEIDSLKRKLAKTTSDLTKVTKEVETGSRTNKTVQELTLTISQLESQLEEVQVKYETDMQGLKIQSYKERAIALAGGEIIPELVSGSTEEEIDNSIESAKKRYNQIQEQAMSKVQMPRAANPATSQMNVFKEKTVSEIASMSREEYAEYRKNIGLK